MRERIENRDYEAVFAHGGCFHFALRLHERFAYPLRGTRSLYDSNCWGHVWARMGGDGVDIRGVYAEKLLSALANGSEPYPVEDVSPEEARAAISKQEYPDELSAEMFRLADWIVDTHERFQSAKPPSPEVMAMLKDLGRRQANQRVDPTSVHAPRNPEGSSED